MAQPDIEAFDHGVVRRLARPAEVQLDAAFIGPSVHHLADEFTPVVCLYGSRFAALVHDSVQHPRYVFAFQALADVDCKALT